MHTDVDHSKMTVRELAHRFRGEMIPLGSTFSYFTALPLPEEDVGQYLHEPIEALPPGIGKFLPKVGILLVPYIEKGAGRMGDLVCYEAPPASKSLVAARILSENQAALFFAVKEQDVSEYHYTFYNAIAALVSEKWDGPLRETYIDLLQEELAAALHGELDERSWKMKQNLLRRPVSPQKDSKVFREYARQSFEDTLTLYLHGICCDIDVETGPRQIPSRYIRKRLEALYSLLPPPKGRAVFPEELNHLQPRSHQDG